MYRLIASDMDETFLDHDHAIPQANVEAVRRLHELGIPFAPSSGRPYDSVMSSLEPIRDLLEGSYVISFNGGTINRVGDPNPIASSPMDFDRMRAIFEYGLGLGDVGFHVYEQTGRMWVWNLSAGEFDYISRLIDFDDLPSASIDFLRDTPVAKIIFNHPDMARLRQIVRDMPAELLDGVDTTFSSGRFLEFMPAGVTKGTGVACRRSPTITRPPPATTASSPRLSRSSSSRARTSDRKAIPNGRPHTVANAWDFPSQLLLE